LGFSVSGNEAPEAANPLPVTEAALTVTAAFPVDVRVTVCVAGIPVATSPKSTLAVLTSSVGVPGFSCSVKVPARPLTLAVSVAVSAELTGETFAVKLALLAPAGTVTVTGTVTSELLLDRFTIRPPAAAGVFSNTVQVSVPAPVIDPLVQFRLVSPGTPVPLKLIAVEAPFEELLARDNCPFSTPAAVGSNCTLSVAVWPGASVTGRPAPVIAKFALVIVAALTVTGNVPVEDRTSECVTAELTGTGPKVRLEALTLRMANAALS
jgi:hypothetical protein